MSSINNCVFTGRLVREPDFRTTSSNKSVCSFSLAVENGWGDNKEMCYPEIIAWGGQADFVSRLPKGTMVAVSCVYKQRTYETKSGDKRKAHEFTAFAIQALESKKTETGAADAEPAQGFESLEDASDDGRLPF